MKEYKLKINGADYDVHVLNVKDGVASLTVNGTQYEVEVDGLKTSPAKSVAKPAASEAVVEPVVAAVKPTGAAQGMRSPLPGVILDVRVKDGAAVKAGQTLMVLEAMKMENNIEADRDGVVSNIRVQKGDSVLEGDTLLTIG